MDVEKISQNGQVTGAHLVEVRNRKGFGLKVGG